MKRLFTLIAMVAFLAACGGNPNKKAKATEETAAVECCQEDTKCCEEEGECCEGEKACCDATAEAGAEETVKEEVAENAE